MNPLKSLSLSFICALLMLASAFFTYPTDRAHAFGVGLSASGLTLSAGTCNFGVSATNTIVLSSIWLFVERGLNRATPQGRYYQKVVAGVDIVLGVPAIDVNFLQTECGLTNVSITKNEANGVSYSSATNYELEFTGQEGGVWKRWHGRIFASTASTVPQLTMNKVDFVPQAPTVLSIERQGAATLGAGATPAFTVTFSKPVINVGANDFVISGPAPVAVDTVSSNAAGDVWTVEIAGAGLANYSGSLGISINPAATINAVDNGVLLDSTIVPPVNETFTIDSHAPSATILHIASNNPASSLAKAGDQITLSMVFNEPLASAPTVTIGGMAAIVSAGAPGNYTATVTVSLATPEGLQAISISGIVDLLGNSAPVVTATTNSSTVSVDTTPPSVTISTAAVAPVSAPFLVNYSFSEPVNGFSGLGIISLLGSLTTAPLDNGDSQNFTSIITPILNPAISIAAGTVSDAAGNLNTVSNTLTLATNVVLGALSSVTIESDSADLGATKARAGDTIRLRFESSVVLRDMPVVTIAGLPASVIDENGMTEFSASVTIGSGAVAQGAVSISVSGLVDLLGNIISAVTSTTDGSSVSIDNILPTATLSTSLAGPINASNPAPFDITVSLNEPVTGLDDTQIFDVQNATLSNLVSISPLEYRVTVTPDGNGNISIGLLGSTLLDLHLNTNILSNIINIILIDNLAPTVTVTTVSGDLSFPEETLDPFDITVTFSEAVFGFTSGSIAVANASASLNTNAPDPQSIFQFTITPDGSGDVTINIAAGIATDNAGNLNLAAAQLTVTMSDSTAPNVTISSDLGSDTMLDSATPFTLTFTFSEPVTGFSHAGLSLSNMNVGAIVPTNEAAGYASIFTAIATPLSQGHLSVGVNGNAAQDASGNFNAASQTFYATYADHAYVQTRTGAVINNFLNRRVKQIAANEPDLSGRLMESGGLGATEKFSYEAKVREGKISASFEGSINRVLERLPPSFGEEDQKHNIWIRGNFSKSSSASANQDFAILYLGVDYRINDNLIVGAITQFDWAQDHYKTDNISASGHGWMVGPYAVIRLADNLVFDGRIAYGKSQNTVNPLGTYVDQYETERLLARGQMTGHFNLGDWTVTPALSMIYIREEQKAYIDDNAILIAPQTVELGQMTFGPSLSREFYMENGIGLSPQVSLKGIWNFKDTGLKNIDDGSALGTDGDKLSARIDAGLSVNFNPNSRLDFSGFYQGIGQSDYQTYGGAIKLNITF
jgi:outer membrane autotransporter protein